MSLRDAIMPFVPGLRRYARALVDGLTDDPRPVDSLVDQTVDWIGAEGGPQPGGSVKLALYAKLTLLNRCRPPHPAEKSGPGRIAGAIATPPSGSSRIQRAVQLLEPDLREIVLLTALERMSYDETAAILELPLTTVIAKLTRARDELRVHFNGTGERAGLEGSSSERVTGHLRLIK